MTQLITTNENFNALNSMVESAARASQRSYIALVSTNGDKFASPSEAGKKTCKQAIAGSSVAAAVAGADFISYSKYSGSSLDCDQEDWVIVVDSKDLVDIGSQFYGKCEARYDEVIQL